MAVSQLPRYFSLSLSVSLGTTTIPRFMEVVDEDGASFGLFIAKGEKILSPFSKMELVDAGSGRVHIRCGYNNKYLAIRSETDHRISPVADAPVEDQSAWSCTMFRITTTTTQSSGVRVTVEHVHLGRRIVAREPDRILQVDQAGGASFELALHDVSAVLALRLPQLITFKNHNGRYAAVQNREYPYIGFWDDNSESIDTVFEILPIDVASFRIRSLLNNKCWKVTSTEYGYLPQIFADTSSELADLPADHLWSEGLFNIHRLSGGDNVFAISHSHSDFGEPWWLFSRAMSNPMLATLSIDAFPSSPTERFVLEEAVKSRSIYNVRYNVLAAKLIPGHPESISTQTMHNDSSVPQSFSRTFTYNETTSTSWNATVSFTYGMSTTVSAGIPFFTDGSLTVGWEFSAAYEWGAEHTTSVTMEDTKDITVPPMTTIAVSRWESKGKYDIPFSYTQEDILHTGEKVVFQKHDGLAIGINNHSIFYNVVETPLATTTSGEEAAREYRIVPDSSRIVTPRA